jgi:cell division protease FtsH
MATTHIPVGVTVKTASESEFQNYLDSNRILEVTIDSEKIYFSVAAEGGVEYATASIVEGNALIQLLRAKGIKFTQVERDDRPNNGDNWVGVAAALIPSLLVAGIGSWLLSRSGGGTSNGNPLTMGKSNARVYGEGKTGVKLADVAGIDEVKAEVQEVIDFLKNGDRYRQLGAKIPKGLLLVGAPGTGKTMLAKAIASEAGVPFYSMSGSEFVEVYVGVGAARVRDLFNRAKRNAPCIIFVDELDAIGKSRSGGGLGGNDEREQTLNQLLVEMDGFSGNSGVILIAATNRPEILDPALKRPGRFDRQIVVDRPDRSGRLAILQAASQGVKLSKDIDLATIATQTTGFVGADLANLVNEAALLAAREKRNNVTQADFFNAMERIVAGLEKRSRVLNETERTTVAYHEVGHAIVGALLPGSGKVSKISIVPRSMGALGYTMQTPQEDRFLLVEDELHGQIATLLAGRVAEEIVFGKISTGASDDIQKATNLAQQAVTAYGMSAKLGPIAFVNRGGQFLEGEAERRHISAEVAAEIDQEVKKIVGSAYDRAYQILLANRSLLETIAQQLLEVEVLEGETLATLLSKGKVPQVQS